MLAKQVNGIVFAKPVKPVDGMYTFQVTQRFPAVEGVLAKETYVVLDQKISSEYISFEKKNDYYTLSVRDEAFQEIEKRVKNLGCETFIYPRFEKGN